MKGNMIQNKTVMSVAALFCCALWGISTPIVKMGYAYVDAENVPSLLLWAGVQFILAGFLTMCVYSVVSKQLVLPQKKSLKGIMLISIFQTVLQYALLYIGLLHTTAVKGAILKSTDVFFVMLIASLLFRQETLTVKKVLSCVIAFTGIIIMNLNGLSLDINLLGDGLVVLGILAYSFSVVITKLVAQDENPAVLCGCQMTLGGIILLLAGVSFGGIIDFVGLLPIILCLSAIYAVSYSIWTALLKFNPASKVTIHSFMTPVFGVIFSALLLKEQGNVPTVNLVAALVLVCGGIIIWGKSSQE